MKEIIQVVCDDLSIHMMMDLDPSFMADFNTKKYNAIFGSAEPEVVNVMKHVLRKGDTAIDGGANVGYFSLIMSALVGDSGKVLAFEPGPDNCRKMRTNIEINNLKNVSLTDRPLWVDSREVTLHMHADSGAHSLRKHDTSASCIVQSTSIDAWDCHPRLVKLDIEGAEIEALEGGYETIRKNRTYIVCEMNKDSLARFGYSETDLRDCAKSLFDYDTFLLSKSFKYPVYIPHGVEVMAPVLNMNVLFATPAMVLEAFPVLHYV